MPASECSLGHEFGLGLVSLVTTGWHTPGKVSNSQYRWPQDLVWGYLISLGGAGKIIFYISFLSLRKHVAPLQIFLNREPQDFDTVTQL